MKLSMKFRQPAARIPRPSGELRIDSMGRFGNYFFSTGWFEGFGSQDGEFEYRFTEQPKAAPPEFAFYRPAEGDSARVHFLHLFWINGGHKLEVGASSALTVALPDSPDGPKCQVHELSDNDFEGFLEALESVASREVWSNRLVFEMVRHCGIDDRSRYVAVALDRVGWQTLDTEFAKMLARRSGENTVREHLSFQCLCIEKMDARHLPSALKAKFIDLTGQLDLSENDRTLAYSVIRQLARFDTERACEFALSVVTILAHDRDELAICVRHCYPQDSQWWIHHALVTPGLGPEQAADALNCAGTAAATEGQTALAMLSYEAALIVNPDARSVAWNAGWLWAGLGDVEKAGELFKRVGRHYPHHSLSTRWPQVRGMPWPNAPMNMECFALPAGVTSWPRITVITPSYNQGCYIEETILSVLNQGYPNLQYIVVDGNSTDDTLQVLDRYRDRFDHLIIESDKGQTEAINKGLRLADGDLVAWLNSDDMYAPGTLHTTALKWLENEADVIAGICVEHSERRIRIFNRPSATNSEFNPPQLARIFKYWFKGYYFYQPEAFFSKRILDAVGLLDESLYYAMDYDLWMRFSKAGAILNVVDWPFAFFRRHGAQKTSEMIHSVEEQSKVRDGHLTLVPDELRTSCLMRMLDAVRRRKTPVLAVCSSRMGISVSPEAFREMTGAYQIITIAEPTAPELATADLILLMVHGPEDLQTVEELRRSAPDCPVVGWLLEHQDHMFESHEIAASVDFVIAAHPSYQRYLRNDQAIQFDAVPAAVFRWSDSAAGEWFQQGVRQTRSADLHGEFEVRSSVETNIHQFLEELGPLLERNGCQHQFEFPTARYGGFCGRESFERRCRYIATLVLPTRHETPASVFDALLAGQIPLVPTECADLDQVISPELQSTLPVFRFPLSDPSGAVDANRMASDRYAAEGPEGALRRHQYALEHHTCAARIASILKLMNL